MSSPTSNKGAGLWHFSVRGGGSGNSSQPCEEIQVQIGNTNRDIDVVDEDDEARILGPLCAIRQKKSFNVGVGWCLLRPETRMSDTPFRVTDFDRL